MNAVIHKISENIFIYVISDTQTAHLYIQWNNRLLVLREISEGLEIASAELEMWRLVPDNTILIILLIEVDDGSRYKEGKPS